MKIITDPSAAVALDRFSVEAVVPVKKRQNRKSDRQKNRDRRYPKAPPVDPVTLSGAAPPGDKEGQGA
ncbi:MAG: hypothetical protein R6V60_08650 [Desulfobacterales bacterium]